MGKMAFAKKLMVILLTIKLTFMWSLLYARHSCKDLTYIHLVFIATVTLLSCTCFTLEETEPQRGEVTCPSSHSLISSRAGFKQVVCLQSPRSKLLCNWVQAVSRVYSGMRTG